MHVLSPPLSAPFPRAYPIQPPAARAVADVEAYAASRSWYVDPSDAVIQQAVRNPFGDVNSTMYVRAGPREESVFAPEEVKAAVVTCGGLCPGLNTVVREVVQCLVRQYGVPESQVWGVEGGYRGFYSRNLVDLVVQRGGAEGSQAKRAQQPPSVKQG